MVLRDLVRNVSGRRPAIWIFLDTGYAKGGQDLGDGYQHSHYLAAGEPPGT
jgi:hypothetical protein